MQLGTKQVDHLNPLETTDETKMPLIHFRGKLRDAVRFTFAIVQTQWVFEEIQFDASRRAFPLQSKYAFA